MKKLFLLIGFVVSVLHLSAQEKLTKDLDGDQRADTVFFDDETSRIVCALSSEKFRPIYSLEIETMGTSGVRSTKSGFEFHTHAMRGGGSCQFRYDFLKIRKIQLIGMSRYEFGNAANDGSGESSVNLLTNSYIGNWSYYDDAKQKLVKLQPIKSKMTFAKTYFESFDGSTFYVFMDKCSKLYVKQKAAAKGKK